MEKRRGERGKAWHEKWKCSRESGDLPGNMAVVRETRWW